MPEPVGSETGLLDAQASGAPARVSAMLPPRGPLRRIVRSFLPENVPALSRHAYRWELISQCFIPLAAACVEGGVVGVIARKGFGASDLAISAITAAPAVANLSSLLWTRVLHGRDRVRAINALQLATIACVVMIALAPFDSALGVAMIVTAMILARTFLTGIINARADLWAHNYPRLQRARITGNLTIVATLLICANSMLIGAIMDVGGDHSHGFRFVYAASAVVALIGVWAFARVRLRGRAALRASEQRGADGRRHAPGVRDMLSLLRKDPVYRRFMWAQFWLGAPVMASDPAFIIALDQGFDLPYSQAIALTQVIPIFVAVLTIPLWARFLDRTHIIRFRAYHSWVFVIAMFLLGAGFITASLPLIYVGRIVLGIANGGGMLAWNLGHHDFAKGPEAALYMGVHVTLTGVRGAFAPFLGVLLYSGSSALAATAALNLPGLGAWAFIAVGVMSIYGAWLFVDMNRTIRARAARSRT